MNGEWCGPTAELPNPSLVKLLDRARRTTCAPPQKKPSDASAPLRDPWFEDSQPQPAPESDPSKPVEIEKPRERRERTAIPKLITRGVYPVYRGNEHVIARAVLCLGVIGAAVVAFAMF